MSDSGEQQPFDVPSWRGRIQSGPVTQHILATGSRWSVPPVWSLTTKQPLTVVTSSYRVKAAASETCTVGTCQAAGSGGRSVVQDPALWTTGWGLPIRLSFRTRMSAT